MHIKRPKATVVCFEGEKKAQKNLPPAAGETPDPCHLSGPEMISYTFRHHTPSDTIHLGLPGGAAGAMDIRPLPRPQIFAGIDTGNTHRRGSQTVLHQVLACITSSRILRVGVLRGAGAQLLLGLVGAKAIQSELVAQCIPLLALYVQARGASGETSARWHGLVQIALQFALCIETQNPTSGMRLRYRTNRGQ